MGNEPSKRWNRLFQPRQNDTHKLNIKYHNSVSRIEDFPIKNQINKSINDNNDLNMSNASGSTQRYAFKKSINLSCQNLR